METGVRGWRCCGFGDVGGRGLARARERVVRRRSVEVGIVVEVVCCVLVVVFVMEYVVNAPGCLMERSH